MINKYINGSPTTQAQMAEWQKKYKFDTGAKKWYDPTDQSVTQPKTEIKPTLETIGAGVSDVAAKTKTLIEKVKTEGITDAKTSIIPTAPTASATPTAPATSATPAKSTTPTTPTTPTEPINYEEQIKTLDKDWETKFESYKTELSTAKDKSDTDKATVLKKMGEDYTDATTAKFDEMITSITDAQTSYLDEQMKYLEEMKAQPSALENLKKFREEQGLPQIEQTLAGIDQTILDTEGLLVNIEKDIRARTEGLPVTEAAARRLTAMERAPLATELTELIRGRTRVAAGMEAKQETVDQFMTAQEADIQQQKEIAQTRLGFKKEEVEFKGTVAEQSFNLFTTLQDRMVKFDELKLDAISDTADYKAKLAEMDFDFFTQQLASKRADISNTQEYEQELIKIQLERDLAAENPEFRFETKTDSAGNVFMIQTNKSTGATDVTNLGGIAKGETPTGVTPGFKFTSNDKGKLLATGLTNVEIDQIQNDINVSGGIGEGLTTIQQNTIEQIQKGTPASQAITTLTEDKLKDIAVALVKKTAGFLGTGTESMDRAKLSIDQGYIANKGKNVYLSQTQINRIKELIDEEYPEGRSWWQAILPGGK